MGRVIVSVLSVILLAFAGCASQDRVDPPACIRRAPSLPASRPAGKPTVVCWSAELDFGLEYWCEEAEDRFGKDVVVLVCHGTSRDGRWVMLPDWLKAGKDVSGWIDAEAAVAGLRAAYPKPTIVLVVCNPGRHPMTGLPGVYYARRSVLVPPFRVSPSARTRFFDVCGSVYEMTEAR